MPYSNTFLQLPYINLSLPEFVELETIGDGVAAATGYADAALSQANSFLGDMTDLLNQVQDIPEITEEIGAVDKVIAAVTLPDAPVRPDGLDFSDINAPATPVLDDVSAPVLPDSPEFTAARPVLSYPVAPDALAAAAPTSPELNAVTIPDAPAIILPSEPSLLGIDIPAVPEIDLPTFDGVLPDVPDTPSVAGFSYVEPEYISSLLTSLQALLESWVGGAATGVSAAVEQAIFDRSRSREEVVSLREAAEIRRSYATTGFPMPPGAMQVALQDAARQAADKISAINREITIKIAEMEQANRQFAIERSIQLEGILIERANGIATRALEAARIAVTSAIDLYQAIVARYQAQLEGFKAQAVVFETLVRAAISKLEIYRGQLEGQRLIGDLNQNAVQVYAERIRAVLSTIESYRAQVQAAEVASNINRNIIARFGEEVNAYQAQVQAKASEYDAYAKQMQAEVVKLDGYKVDADVFRSQMDGYESLVRARSLEKDIELKVKHQTPMEVFRSNVEAYTSLVRGESDRVRALADVYSSDVSKYSAHADALTKLNASEVAEYRAKSDTLIQGAQVRIQALTANVERLVKILSVATEIARSGGAISAQLAASAMSMLNFNQSISQSDGQSRSVSYSSSESNSTSYSANESVSWNFNYSKSLDGDAYSLSQLNTY